MTGYFTRVEAAGNRPVQCTRHTVAFHITIETVSGAARIWRHSPCWRHCTITWCKRTCASFRLCNKTANQLVYTCIVLVEIAIHTAQINTCIVTYYTNALRLFNTYKTQKNVIEQLFVFDFCIVCFYPTRTMTMSHSKHHVCMSATLHRSTRIRHRT